MQEIIKITDNTVENPIRNSYNFKVLLINNIRRVIQKAD